ncbi:LacI family DNA-binding transcriptional regulator [Quadrisphaera sp. INWT6]|uniref:LacI family DNA-binding transcriptional regulator n=1 Tax=Quadrisphaera sp. INWT6 TaxID=2596917 RepID=UPI0018921D3F|nr:LacI family DNA-binding transcriptional regulator [Quadrisphaera sp. INWT6]MBF5080893.1 LacI family transcriptional regulator [Quadrisphaera sp. INWT6]
MAQRSAKATIADVAREAGVSKGTVSLALSGHGPVASTTRERVLAAAARLDWVPSARARSLSTHRADALGLVLAREPEHLGADPFFAPFIAGVEAALSPRGQALVLHVVSDPEHEREAYRRLAAGRVDGALLTDLRVDDARPALLEGLGLPALAVGHQRGSALPQVALDDRSGVRAVVDHLADLGHRRLAHVTGSQQLVHGVDRLEAFREAAAARGLPEPVVYDGDFSPASGAAAARSWLADRATRGSGEVPTAIVAGGDLMATAVLAVLARAGVRVPHDVSVTGFDDAVLAAHLTPALTTVRSDALAWGRAAADALLDLVGGGGERPDVDLPAAQLVVRASTGTPPA